MSDRGMHFGGPERKRTPEDMARDIKQVATEVATLIKSNPALERLPDEQYREVDEAQEDAGRYLGWEGLEKQPLMDLTGHELTIRLHYRTVMTFVRALPRYH